VRTAADIEVYGADYFNPLVPRSMLLVLSRIKGKSMISDELYTSGMMKCH
jgi:hypothetical protein